MDRLLSLEALIEEEEDRTSPKGTSKDNPRITEAINETNKRIQDAFQAENGPKKVKAKLRS